jgi:ribonuclease HI
VIKFPDGTTTKKAIATGPVSTNYRAESSALLSAAQLLSQQDSIPDHTVFLTDCRAVLQSIQTRERDRTLQDLRAILQALGARTTVVLQWIPSHCGIAGNEEADRLSKAGSRLEQTAHPLSFGEAKTILRSHFRTNWRQRRHLGTQEDPIHLLGRPEQVIHHLQATYRPLPADVPPPSPQGVPHRPVSV